MAVYVVWSAQLGAEERHVPGAARLLPDARATHFWDPGLLAGAAFASIVGSAEPAWDVWMLFGPETTWHEDPPTPAWWEHQLGGLPANRHLDPERFTKRARELSQGAAMSR